MHGRIKRFGNFLTSKNKYSSIESTPPSCQPPTQPPTHSPNNPLTNQPTHPATHSPSHPLTQPTHSPSHPLTNQPTHPATHSPTHPTTHSPNHPLTHQPRNTAFSQISPFQPTAHLGHPFLPKIAHHLICKQQTFFSTPHIYLPRAQGCPQKFLALCHVNFLMEKQKKKVIKPRRAPGHLTPLSLSRQSCPYIIQVNKYTHPFIPSSWKATQAWKSRWDQSEKRMESKRWSIRVE